MDSAFYLKLVGFGYTNIVLRDFGVKNKVNVMVASNSCDTPTAEDGDGSTPTWRSWPAATVSIAATVTAGGRPTSSWATKQSWLG